MSNGAVPGGGLAAGAGTEVVVEGGDWREALSADLRGDAHVQAYDDLETFTKTAVSAQHMIGKKGVIQPGDNASVEDYARYYEQLGRPTNVDKYAAKDFEDVEWHEAVVRDEKGESAMLQEMYDAGLNPYQAERLYAKFAGVNSSLAEQFTEAQEVNHQSLETQLSEEFGFAKDARLEAANKAWVKVVGSPERATELANVKLADGTLLGHQIDLIKGMAELGQHIDGDGMVGSKQASFSKTPAEAKEEVSALMGDAGFLEAWTTKGHPGHAEAQKRFTEASAAARGEG